VNERVDSYPAEQVYDPFPHMAYSEPGGEGGMDATDRVSIGSATDDDDEDEFELLKKKRDEERQSRLVCLI